MVAPVRQVYRYRVNQADHITFVDEWWLAFAAENRATGVDEASILGRSIWDFIADEPTRQLYRELHDRVRSSNQPIEVPFRCDSPTLRRYMQLTIHHEGEGQLRYESVLLRVSPQRRLRVLNPAADRSNAFLTMCSFCKRSLIEPAGWLELEDIALKLRMYDQPRVPELHYTVCPDCEKQLAGQ